MQGHKSQFRDKQSRFPNQSVPARKGPECDLNHVISLQARQEESSLERAQDFTDKLVQIARYSC
jgi:hypothetical protein